MRRTSTETGTWAFRALRRELIVAALICLCGSGLAQDGEPTGPPVSEADVTIPLLLQEMTDPAALVRGSEIPYRLNSFTSRDPESRDRTADSWFSTDDRDHFLRIEKRGPRQERVLAEMSGPGAIVRIWVDRPVGTLRVYVDGGALPVVMMESQLLFTGQLAIFSPPLAGGSGDGFQLRFPIPFENGVKVTCDADGFAYQVVCRSYPEKTKVESFMMRSAVVSLYSAMPALEALASSSEGDAHLYGGATAVRLPPAAEVVLEAGQAQVVFEKQVEAPEAITVLATEELLNFLGPATWSGLRVRIAFDDVETVDAPLGALFGGADRFVPFVCRAVHGQLLLADTLRRRALKLLMPFRRSVRITLINQSPARVAGLRFLTETAPMAMGEPWAYFHAWTTVGRDLGGEAIDWPAATIVGRGRLVAEVLEVDRSGAGTWDEGGAKVWVDGDTQPSFFGTRLAHEFGVTPAWSGAWDGAFERGHAASETMSAARFRYLDAVPFDHWLGLDLELHPPTDSALDVVSTIMFYAEQGARRGGPVDRVPVAQEPPPADDEGR